jgi:uncharacterized protein YyaL (SSP411 family)
MGLLLHGRGCRGAPGADEESYDGAIPSGNSVAAVALLRLSKLTGDPWGEARARAVLMPSPPWLRLIRPGTFLLGALDLALGPAQEIVITGPPETRATPCFARSGGASFRAPCSCAELRGPWRNWGTLVPSLGSIPSVEKTGTAYVCEEYSCDAPRTTARELAAALQTAGPAASSASVRSRPGRFT